MKDALKLCNSIAISVNIYEDRTGKTPDKIFMSDQAFYAVANSWPYKLTRQLDNEITFMGIPVERYEASRIEYYFGERGDIW